MLLRELTSDLYEAMTWARSGQKVVRKFRCSGGKRHGRIVAKPQQCFAAPNMAKSVRLKKLKARMGSRLARKAKRTKRVNPISKRVSALNKGKR